MAALLLVWLAPAAALAQLTSAQESEIYRQSSELKVSLQRKLTAACGLPSELIDVPSVVVRNDASSVAGTSQYRFSVKRWTGGCLEGRRDGYGTLETETIESATPVPVGIIETATFANGQRVGLRCLQPDKVVATEVCGLMGAVSVAFRPDEDKRWRILAKQQDQSAYSFVEPAVHIVDGQVEAASERAVADARAGRAPQPVTLKLETPSLSDLTPGGAMALAPAPFGALTNLRGKRVAVILTTGSLAELTRYASQREALLKQSRYAPLAAGVAPPPLKLDTEDLGLLLQTMSRDDPMPEDATQAMRGFAERTEPSLVVRQIADLVRKAGGQPLAADDLSVLQDQRADLAIVVDWRYKWSPALDAAAYRRLAVCPGDAPDTCQNPQVFTSQVSAYLFDSSIVVVRQYHSMKTLQKSPTQIDGIGDVGNLFYDMRHSIDWIRGAMSLVFDSFS